jgi:hypothetical protein
MHTSHRKSFRIASVANLSTISANLGHELARDAVIAIAAHLATALERSDLVLILHCGAVEVGRVRVATVASDDGEVGFKAALAGGEGGRVMRAVNLEDAGLIPVAAGRGAADANLGKVLGVRRYFRLLNYGRILYIPMAFQWRCRGWK